ncbi:hypothetical protein FPHYL_7914 [Fusarium phyllophilum]|uniref:SNF2 N-terminal domain-containing protein n=1 Tax=Fusarium phyllophilum TaxID=47803 RepID=A0A8H5JJE7_9HYPO|nr:hypothetical protein FPHYL_7914 [Fusarium phyllophilum]
MAYSNTSHGSVHALFEASFQKLTDAVSSDTATASHKAHCDRIEKHLPSGIASSARAKNLRTLTSSNKTALPHRRPANHLGNTDFHSHLDIFDALNTEPKHWQTARVGKLVWLAKYPIQGRFPCRCDGIREKPPGIGRRHSGEADHAHQVCVYRNRHTGWLRPPMGRRDKATLQTIDGAKVDTTRLLDYDIVIFSHDFLKSQYRESVTLEYFCHTRVALGDSEAKRISKRSVERPNAVLHSEYYGLISCNIAVPVLYESHDCRNDESLYFDVVKSSEYHHLFTLTGTPVFNRSEDIVRQSRLMPDGGLFSSLEHFKALFYEYEEQKFPTGV